MHTVYFRLIGKLIVDFLLVIVELFLMGVFVSSKFTRLMDRQTDKRLYDGQYLACIQSAVKTADVEPQNSLANFVNKVLSMCNTFI